MNLNVEKMDEFVKDTGYIIRRFYEDENINLYFNFYVLIEQNESFLSNRYDIDADDLLYAEYYWFTKFKNEYKKKYDNDEGIEQQQFKLLEEMDQRLVNGIDWDKIKYIEDLL